MGFNPTNKPLFEAVVQQGFESETPRLPVWLANHCAIGHLSIAEVFDMKQSIIEVYTWSFDLNFTHLPSVQI